MTPPPLFSFGDPVVKNGRCPGGPNEVTHDIWSKGQVAIIQYQLRQYFLQNRLINRPETSQLSSMSDWLLNFILFGRSEIENSRRL